MNALSLPPRSFDRLSKLFRDWGSVGPSIESRLNAQLSHYDQLCTAWYVTHDVNLEHEKFSLVESLVECDERHRPRRTNETTESQEFYCFGNSFVNVRIFVNVCSVCRELLLNAFDSYSTEIRTTYVHVLREQLPFLENDFIYGNFYVLIQILMFADINRVQSFKKKEQRHNVCKQFVTCFSSKNPPLFLYLF